MKAVERMLAVEKAVSSNNKRLYWRFRVDKWYGGVVTADCFGCGLDCTFCWVNRWKHKQAKMYSPAEVVGALHRLSTESHINMVRLSGGEPTLNIQHLSSLLSRINRRFILETNGILLAVEPERIEALKPFREKIWVRVGIKGATAAQFTELTKGDEEDWYLQLDAFKQLREYGFYCHPAVMAPKATPSQLKLLEDELDEELEVEKLLYSWVEK